MKSLLATLAAVAVLAVVPFTASNAQAATPFKANLAIVDVDETRHASLYGATMVNFRHGGHRGFRSHGFKHKSFGHHRGFKKHGFKHKSFGHHRGFKKHGFHHGGFKHGGFAHKGLGKKGFRF
ncbi:MAG: hypothetical protein AAFO70_00415 [Pseudomonadota bacterium]